MSTDTTTTTVTGVDFVCIPTQDFARARAFYESVLGLPFSKQWGDMPAGEFETGTVTLAVMQSDAFGQEFRPHSVPIALRVDDVDTTRAELETKGVTFVHQFDSGVCHQAIFTDPDGNPLALHHRYAPKEARPG